MKCANCGSDMPANAKFCGVCGAAAEDSAQQAIAQTVALDTSNSPEIKAAADALLAQKEEKQDANEAPTGASDSSDQDKDAEAKSDADVVKESESTTIGSSSAKAAPKKDTAKKPAKQEEAPKGEDDASNKGRGKFRETIWFMQADDPEMMSSIENENLSDREATYQDPGGQLDDRSREKFSLIFRRPACGLSRGANLEDEGKGDDSKAWFWRSRGLLRLDRRWCLFYCVKNSHTDDARGRSCRVVHHILLSLTHLGLWWRRLRFFVFGSLA